MNRIRRNPNIVTQIAKYAQKNFHYSVAKLLIDVLIKVLKQAFSVKEDPAFDCYPNFYPGNITTLIGLSPK